MLGLRLDEPLPLEKLESSLDSDALERLVGLGLAELHEVPGRAQALTLTARGRFLGGAVTAELLA